MCLSLSASSLYRARENDKLIFFYIFLMSVVDGWRVNGTLAKEKKKKRKMDYVGGEKDYRDN